MLSVDDDDDIEFARFRTLAADNDDERDKVTGGGGGIDVDDIAGWS